ncbi:hypothetical protein GXW84_27025 [Rhodococcus sp. IEGM 248]|nr:hypothetical protein [Rhodococcus sp. IEGM 248]
MNLAWQEASNERSAAHEFVVAVPIGAAPHLKARVQDAKRVVAKNDVILEQIRRDAERNGTEVGAVKRKPKDQDVIKIASRSIHPAPQYNEFGPEKEALATWRFLSAHAHGQGWAANTTSQTVADPDSGIPRTMWNPDIEMAMQGVRIAWALLYAAFAQYDCRPSRNSPGVSVT